MARAVWAAAGGDVRRALGARPGAELVITGLLGSISGASRGSSGNLGEVSGNLGRPRSEVRVKSLHEVQSCQVESYSVHKGLSCYGLRAVVLREISGDLGPSRPHTPFPLLAASAGPPPGNDMHNPAVVGIRLVLLALSMPQATPSAPASLAC